MSGDASAAVLERGTSGVLALAGDDGYPYAVPLSYVYCGGKLFFHSAVQGHKLDAIARCDKASFCVACVNFYRNAKRVNPSERSAYCKRIQKCRAAVSFSYRELMHYPLRNIIYILGSAVHVGLFCKILDCRKKK
jgi:hypothetical protein